MLTLAIDTCTLFVMLGILCFLSSAEIAAFAASNESMTAKQQPLEGGEREGLAAELK